MLKAVEALSNRNWRQDAEIEYLQGMLGQKTKKRHPLRMQNHERSHEKLERGHQEKGQRGGWTHHPEEREVYKKHGRRHTVDDAASVYAPSNISTSPRAMPLAPRQGRRGRGHQSPKRSRTGSSLPRSHSSLPGGALLKASQRAWMMAITPKEAQEVWKERLPAVSSSSKRPEGKGVALLPYLGTHRKTPELGTPLLPVRRASQPNQDSTEGKKMASTGNEADANLPIAQAKELTDEGSTLYDSS